MRILKRSINPNGLIESTLKEWIKENFEMDGDLVHSEVSKMIISEELKASWDEPTNSLGKLKFTSGFKIKVKILLCDRGRARPYFLNRRKFEDSSRQNIVSLKS